MPPLNPKPYLASLVGQPVAVRLKWGTTEYRGRLDAVDTYMNFRLSGASEYADGVLAGAVGAIFIRCNNVLYIRGVEN